MLDRRAAKRVAVNSSTVAPDAAVDPITLFAASLLATR
jgi:hypothetical protein